MRLSALAESSGVSTPFLSLVETGERQPSLLVLRKLAGSLGIPPEVLIILSQPTSGNLQSADKRNQSLVTAIQKLMSVEQELQAKLGTEARKSGSKGRDD